MGSRSGCPRDGVHFISSPSTPVLLALAEVMTLAWISKAIASLVKSGEFTSEALTREVLGSRSLCS